MYTSQQPFPLTIIPRLIAASLVLVGVGKRRSVGVLVSQLDQSGRIGVELGPSALIGSQTVGRIARERNPGTLDELAACNLFGSCDAREVVAEDLGDLGAVEGTCGGNTGLGREVTEVAVLPSRDVLGVAESGAGSGAGEGL